MTKHRTSPKFSTEVRDRAVRMVHLGPMFTTASNSALFSRVVLYQRCQSDTRCQRRRTIVRATPEGAISIMFINHRTSVSLPRSRRYRISHYSMLLVALVQTQIVPSVEAGGSKERHTAAKTVSGWVCNAYGLAGGWQTVTGSPSPTKLAALASVMKDCQRSLFACRTTGCWPRQ